MIPVLRPLAQFERKSQSGDLSLAESIFGLLTTCLTYGGSDVILVNSKLEFLPSERSQIKPSAPDSILLWNALGRELCSLLEELDDDEVIISILLDPFVRENVKIIGKSSLPHVEIAKPYCEKIVRRFEKVEPVILQRMKLVSDAKKSVSDNLVVKNQVDRGFQSDGASILSLLFKELQKPETTTCLGEWNQFLSVQVEEIPDLVFWRRYCDGVSTIAQAGKLESLTRNLSTSCNCCISSICGHGMLYFFSSSLPPPLPQDFHRSKGEFQGKFTKE